ncbi:MAG: TonB-dependent receptor, partial [Gemmatimonadota bacterium]
PGELVGHVTDAITGKPVENVLVEVLGTGLTAVSDGRGAFRIRGLEPGRHTLRISRLGYEPRLHELEVRRGEPAWLAVRLGVRPVRLHELRAEVERGAAARAEAPGAIAIPRDEIEHSGAATAADLLEGRAGLVVGRRGPSGQRTVSIRGSSADEVLVLVDGAPLNDPLTGAADLSAIPASQIESITVLKGSQSARFGRGAEAGVVLIESRTTAAPLGVRLETGSLGAWSGTTETSTSGLGLNWSLGGQLRRLAGEFEYERPAELGGSRAVRQNSDLWEGSAFAAATGPVGGGVLRLRAGYSRLERGLPGPSYLPTPEAREGLSRWRSQAAWERQRGRARVSALVHGIAQRAHFSDPSPPAGLPYDSHSDALALGSRLATEVSLGGLIESLSGGLELRQQSYESTTLGESAPDGRLDLGLFAGSALAPFGAAGGPRLVAALRFDRDGLDRLWRMTHELLVTAGAGPAMFHLRHASSYSPPSFGDQFFKEGVAVEPNPDLRAERIPSDLSLGVSVAGHVGAGVLGRLAVDGYIADVKDMIIWAPDFRFVWSPRNFDVKRRGLDLDAEIELPAQRLALRAAYTLARVTYDRPGGADTVQVVYRPRHSGGVSTTWRPAHWEIRVDARFIGTRYPVPAHLNALDPYWTLDLRLRRSFTAGGWELTPTLAVDRLLDNEDSLIFGYPEPGRTSRFELAVRPRGTR